jgi:cell division protein FtsB
MNPFEFVLAVMILMFVFTIVRHKMGIQVGSRRQMREDSPVSDPENDRLNAQVQQLQERIKVLERIVTDRGVETAAQIEALRDREAIGNGDKIQ